MRKGWDEGETTAPEVARRVQDAGAVGDRGARAHGQTVLFRLGRLGLRPCRCRRRVDPGLRLGRLHRAASRSSISCGSGVSGVFVGRGVLRNPWILAQAQDLLAGRPTREVTAADRAAFLLDYIDLLSQDRPRRARRLPPPGAGPAADCADAPPARSRERWVINKVRALCTLVHQGIRQRLASPDCGERRRVDSGGARHHRAVLPRRLGPSTRRRGRRLASAPARRGSGGGPLTVVAGLRVAIDLDGTVADLSAAMHAVATRRFTRDAGSWRRRHTGRRIPASGRHCVTWR